jgi:hypothetical protein
MLSTIAHTYCNFEHFTTNLITHHSTYNLQPTTHTPQLQRTASLQYHIEYPNTTQQ